MLDLPVEQKINVAADTLGVNDAMWEHLDVHQLILAVVEELFQRLAVFLLEDLSGLPGLAWVPVADDGVHRVVSTAAVHRQPAQFFGLAPVGKLPIRAGMFDHVADFVGGRLVQAKVMIAGVDDKDVASCTSTRSSTILLVYTS